MPGRIVVVTGASQGIGFEVARSFAAAGDTVIATSRSAGDLDVASGGAPVAMRPLDVTDQASVDDLADYVLRTHGHVDIVVNNAGRGFRGTTEDLSVDDLTRSLDVNFLGAARVTKAFLPAMRASGRGHLIAVSSIAGVVGQPFNDAYCAAKFALEGLYESLHPVAAATGVRVSLVEPGPVISQHDARARNEISTDPQLLDLQRRYLVATASAATYAQSAAEAAAVVLDCADDPNPRLRYQTSRLAERIIGLKLSDMSGDAITALTAGWLTASPA